MKGSVIFRTCISPKMSILGNDLEEFDVELKTICIDIQKVRLFVVLSNVITGRSICK
jgi:hypothetical protein